MILKIYIHPQRILIVYITVTHLQMAHKYIYYITNNNITSTILKPNEGKGKGKGKGRG